jgi:hypothetical protein
LFDVFRAGFKNERLGRLPGASRKRETESTGFVEIFASLKSRKVTLYF